MGISVLFGGTDRTPWIGASSLRIRRRLANRASLTATLRDRARGWRPTLGQTIDVLYGSEYLFRGFVWRMEERRLPGTSTTEIDLEAVDYNHIAARRLVKGQYSGWYLPNIISHIVATGLSGEGVVVASGVPQIVLPGTITFYYQTVAQALTALADLAGCIWWIDHNKRLQFAPFSAWNASWGVTDDSDHVLEFSLVRTLEDYRNRQWVRCEPPQFPSEWEDVRTIPGPGQWMLSSRWVIQELYEIKVDGVSKTFVGVGSSPLEIPESGYDFFYIVGAGGVFTLDFVAEGGETVWFRYKPGDPWEQYEYGMKVIAESSDEEISRMAGLTGGSGIWEAIEDAKMAGDTDAMVNIARARLRRYATNGLRGTLRTTRIDVAPGMKVPVQSAVYGFNGTMFIETVEHQIDWSPFGEIVRTTAQLSDSEPAIQVPSDYFGKLIEMARIGIGGAGGSESAGGWTTNWRGGWLLASGETARGAQTLSRSLLYGSVYGVDHTVEDDLVGRRLRRVGTDLGVEG